MEDENLNQDDASDLKMKYAIKAFELISELDDTQCRLPHFNEDLVRQVLDEINALFDANHRDAMDVAEVGQRSKMANLRFRHMSIQRNNRCLLAYLYNRLQRIRDVRWKYGGTIPEDIKKNLCEPEIQWFNSYSKTLSNYMKSIGDNGGINLTEYVQPPKSLFIEVRCLRDYGEFELEDGEIINLRKDNCYCLPRIETEVLIQQGYLDIVE